MLKSKLFFVRHGQSKANSDHVIAGQCDSPLTRKGVQEAKDVADEIVASGLQFDIIFSSPLSRALDTAKHIAVASGYSLDKIVIIDELKEKSAGTFEGKAVGAASEALQTERDTAGVETDEALARRVRKVNARLLRHTDANMLIVGHSGFYRMARCLATGFEPSAMNDIPIPRPKNATLIEYLIAS